jgi:hypothetical protein
MNIVDVRKKQMEKMYILMLVVPVMGNKRVAHDRYFE